MLLLIMRYLRPVWTSLSSFEEKYFATFADAFAWTWGSKAMGDKLCLEIHVSLIRLLANNLA